MNSSAKKMSIYICVSIIIVLLIVFFLLLGHLTSRNALLQQKYEQMRQESVEAQRRNTELNKLLSYSSDNNYVKEYVRKNYDYVSQNERRIIILHPEVLYETTDADNS